MCTLHAYVLVVNKPNILLKCLLFDINFNLLKCVCVCTHQHTEGFHNNIISMVTSYQPVLTTVCNFKMISFDWCIHFRNRISSKHNQQPDVFLTVECQNDCNLKITFLYLFSR